MVSVSWKLSMIKEQCQDQRFCFSREITGTKATYLCEMEMVLEEEEEEVISVVKQNKC
jgi:hypothetical protein